MEDRKIIIEYEDPLYIAIDFETKVASQGYNVENAKNNLQEALELYFDKEVNMEDMNLFSTAGVDRPVTTLFMLMSVDGKISTGSLDNLDMDRDLPLINGLKEGLQQYYSIEETTDLFSLNTGRVMSKIGVNNKKGYHDKVGVRFVIVDNKPHLTKEGIDYLCHWVDKLLLVTTNKNHPAYDCYQYDNLEVISQRQFNLHNLLAQLKLSYKCDRLTIQSGGNLNGLFLREKLIDYVDVVVAPVLVGGRNTPTLIDGESIRSVNELDKLGILRLIDCIKLENSYMRLKYEVVR